MSRESIDATGIFYHLTADCIVHGCNANTYLLQRLQFTHDQMFYQLFLNELVR